MGDRTVTADISREAPSGAAMRPRPVVAVDFHGVICEHPEGSKGLTEPGWPEVPGAIEWLGSITPRYAVHLVSARFSRPGIMGRDAMLAARGWLVGHGIPMAWMVSSAGEARITFAATKPVCVLWVDDRAFCFRGTFPTADEIESFRPWNR